MSRPVSGPRGRQRDSGVTLVLVTISLAALLTVSAFAVDIGRAYTERRHDQNVVDSAAMSGAVESVYGGGAIQDAVDEIVAKVNATLDSPLSTADWTSCTDGEALPHTAAEMGLTPPSPCISFSLGYEELRVRLPDQRFHTALGGIVGVDTITTNAAAQARIVPPEGAGAPPFIALESAQKGDFVCLRTGGTNSDEPISLMDGMGPGNPAVAGVRPDPCNDDYYPTSSSAFGTVKPHAYQDACQQRNEEIKLAIAIGMDHLLGVFPGGYNPDPTTGVDPRTRPDGDNNCVGPLAARPNTLEIDTGFAAQDLKCALLSPKNSDTCENEYPRLRPGSESSYPTSPTVVGERFDNTTPWTFLHSAQALFDEGAPDSCVIVAAARTADEFDLMSDSRFNSYRAQYPNYQDGNWDPHDYYDEFTRCLQDWTPTITLSDGSEVNAPELFTEDIGLSPRFAFIPQVAEDTIVNGQDVHIEGFRPVYLFRLYISTNNQPMCGPHDNRPTKFWVHDAGNTWSCGASNDNVDRLSSIVYACGMVPDSLCDKETLIPVSAGLDAYDIELTR